MKQMRAGFTLVEVLVAMALTMFVMVILSQAFVAGLDTFSGLKAVGDMQEDMRTASNLLKADLAVDHIDGKRRLSDPFLGSEPIREGFLRVVQLTPSQLEGTTEGPISLGGIPSWFAGDQHYLHFANKQRGNQRERFYAADIPANSPLVGLSTSLLQDLPMENNASLRDNPLIYKSPWAEVAWFLLPQGTVVEPNNATGIGTPLYGLYRAQFVVPPVTSNLSGGLATAATQPGIACIDDPTLGTVYRNPNDLVNPALRVFDPSNRSRSASLVLKNVLNFQIQILRSSDLDFVDPPSGVYDTSLTPYPIQAIRINLRVWDVKTQQARQVTVIQDL